MVNLSEHVHAAVWAVLMQAGLLLALSFRVHLSASMLGYIWNVGMSVFGLGACWCMCETGHN